MIKRAIGRFLARHRRNRIVTGVDRFLLELHRGYENLNYDYLENGEKFVLETVARHLRVKTVFDVGANEGEWSRIAAGVFPEAIVHSFEILPETHRRLAEQCRSFERILPWAAGLGDAEKETEVYYSTGRGRQTTCVGNFFETFHGRPPQSGRAKVLTGDGFCEREGISGIDFLKLDVEGYEEKVLRGFRGMLAAGKVKIVQFEYGYVNIAAGFLLRDFYRHLGSLGMRLGKIYPGYVEFKDYRFQDENFLGPNYLAVHASLAPLITDLRDGGRRAR
jgi:FkbM family methyltransferase